MNEEENNMEKENQKDIQNADDEFGMHNIIGETAAAYAGGLRKKNCIDKDLYMHIPEELRKLYINGKDTQPPSALDHENLLNYECTDINKVPGRTITEEEYNVIPDFLKKRSGIVLYTLKRNLVKNIILAVLFAIILAGLKGLLLLAAVLILFIVFSYFSIGEYLSAMAFMIRKDTQVKTGYTARFTTKTTDETSYTDHEYTYYYIDLFMDEHDVIAKKVEIPVKMMKDLELNSKVWVIGKHFIYQKDGKWNMA